MHPKSLDWGATTGFNGWRCLTKRLHSSYRKNAGFVICEISWRKTSFKGYGRFPGAESFRQHWWLTFSLRSLTVGSANVTWRVALAGVTRNNLRGLDAAFPLACLSVDTGISGSGKSSLVGQALHDLVAERPVRLGAGAVLAKIFHRGAPAGVGAAGCLCRAIDRACLIHLFGQRHQFRRRGVVHLWRFDHSADY